MEKPHHISLTDKQWKRTIEYFEKKRKARTDQKLRKALNKPRKRATNG